MEQMRQAMQIALARLWKGKVVTDTVDSEDVLKALRKEINAKSVRMLKGRSNGTGS